MRYLIQFIQPISDGQAWQGPWQQTRSKLFRCRLALATLPFVPLLEDRFGPWKSVSRLAGIDWLCFYALFLLYAAFERSGFLFLDYVNLMIHEGIP